MLPYTKAVPSGLHSLKKSPVGLLTSVVIFFVVFSHEAVKSGIIGRDRINGLRRCRFFGGARVESFTHGDFLLVASVECLYVCVCGNG